MKTNIYSGTSLEKGRFACIIFDPLLLTDYFRIGVYVRLDTPAHRVY